MDSLCKDCRKSPLLNSALGPAKKCGHQTSPRGSAYCQSCAKEEGSCQQCGLSFVIEMMSILAEPKPGFNDDDVVAALNGARAQDVQILSPGFVSAKLPRKQLELVESVAWVHEKQLHKRMA